MFKSLEIFQVSQAMARHAAARQALVAQNMANADTPGYVPRDLAPFRDLVGRNSATGAMRATRSGHFDATLNPAPERPAERRADTAPNGNAVSLEEEMMRAVDVKRQHDRALAVYRSSLTVLRATLGRQ